MSEQSNGEGQAVFKSALKEGRQRFLAHAIEHALEIGRRSADDFIRHFPPSTIMEGLEHQPGLRAAILVLTTGLKKRIATKKSWQSAAEDLQIALDERETDAESIVAVFNPDDRVRYLDNQQIWAMLVEGEFWNTPASEKDAFERAKAHVAFMLDRALADRLLTHRDVVEGITVAELATRLPKSELGMVIEAALNNSHDNKPFTEADLLTTRPPEVLVKYVPLAHIWNSVIVPKVALAHGYVAPPPAPEQEASEAASEPSPPSQDWVEASSNSEMPSLGDEETEDEEVSDEDFAVP